MSKTRLRWGYGLIIFGAVASILVPVLVDFNQSHLFNPNWPGHARLHDAMSFLMSMGLGVGSLWLLAQFRRSSTSVLALATFLAVWSWGALLLGAVFPGATYVNAAEAESMPPALAALPLPINALLSVIIIVLGVVGFFLLNPGKASD